MNRRRLFLPGLASGADFALLLARLLTGGFLVHGVWDNVVNPARMTEFVGFVAANGFPAPALVAPFSVYTQLLAGVGLIAGLLTRWSALVVVATFVVALAMVHRDESIREMWPAAALVALGLIFATVGGGRFALDRLWARR